MTAKIRICCAPFLAVFEKVFDRISESVYYDTHKEESVNLGILKPPLVCGYSN